ncbi:unnamed protein product [Lathyrus oleraceus]
MKKTNGGSKTRTGEKRNNKSLPESLHHLHSATDAYARIHLSSAKTKAQHTEPRFLILELRIIVFTHRLRLDPTTMARPLDLHSASRLDIFHSSCESAAMA